MTVHLIANIIHNIFIFMLRIEKNSFPKPLSLKQEKEFFIDMRKNNKNARDMLIKHNLRLVAHIVKKYYVNVSDHDDLISIGTIGLIKAVESYDFNKGIKFATYASRCIENEILMHFRQTKKNLNDLYFGDTIFASKANDDSLFLNTLTGMDDVVDLVELKCQTDVLYKLMKTTLNLREKKVLIYRYGLYGKKTLTQNETAKKLNISRSYVSRIEKNAIKKLAKKFKST